MEKSVADDPYLTVTETETEYTVKGIVDYGSTFKEVLAKIGLYPDYDIQVFFKANTDGQVRMKNGAGDIELVKPKVGDKLEIDEERYAVKEVTRFVVGFRSYVLVRGDKE